MTQKRAKRDGGAHGLLRHKRERSDTVRTSTWLFAALVATTTSAAAALSVGAVAPDFAVEAAQGGKTFTFRLAEALTHGPVVVYFYPKSFTSTCTLEAHEFAEAMPSFAAAGASVIGISSDKIDTQRQFSSMECRDKFPVGADPTFSVIKAYDAAFAVPLAGPMFANRVSFVVAPDGKIIETLQDSGAKLHIQNALTAVRTWRAANP